MPVRSVKKLILNNDQDDSPYFQFCDWFLIVVLILILGCLGKGIYGQVYVEQTKLHQQSILCIKDFDSNGCNPFNMSNLCKDKLDCIKHGDGLSLSDIIEIANKHIRNNGAIPIFIVMLVVVNQVRRRYYQNT